MTKLQPPVVRYQTVPRADLVDRLAPLPGVRLTVIAAPAGAGKTTLLGLWCAAQASVRRIAWVSLDRDDGDPVTLWVHALEAIQRACPGIDVSSSPEVVGGARIVAVLLPELVNALAGQGDVALVLDDFHLLPAGMARDSVAWLVEHAPSTLQVLVSSRTEPALPLAALRARGELNELRADDLAFGSGEAGALLNGRLRLGLTGSDVEDLVARTQGWAAGLYLAGLSLEKAPDRRAFVARFSGGHRHVVEYLLSEVIEAHDTDMQELMLRSSILGRMCGSLCDAILDRNGSAKDLKRLSRTNLFLTVLDDEGEWYRFHHLFAQLLRIELEHRDPGLAPALHMRACAWFRERGLVDEAVEHALTGGDLATAADLVAEFWGRYLWTGRFTTLLGWLGRFPADLLGSDARLLMTKAWVLAITGHGPEADEILVAVEALGGLDQGPLPDGFVSIEASLATLRAQMSGFGSVTSMLDNGLRAAELVEPQSPWRPIVLWTVGKALYIQGRLDEADRWLAEGAQLALHNEHWVMAIQTVSDRSLIAGEQGRLSDQIRLAQHALGIADERGINYLHGSEYIAHGAALATQGRHKEALSIYDLGMVPTRELDQPVPLAFTLVVRATVVGQANDHQRTAAAIAEAEAAVDRCTDSGTLRDRLEQLKRSLPRHPRSEELSERERAVLRMLSGPLSEREIARELYLSVNTVHSHTKSIYRKLGVSSRGEAVEKARAAELPRRQSESHSDSSGRRPRPGAGIRRREMW